MSDYEPLNFVCDDGDLSISGVAMRGTGWAVLDLAPLWLPAVVRGESRVVPGAAGVIANPKRKTITRHTLILAVTGGYDQAGNQYPDPWVGLKANIDYLVTNVFDPPTLPAVTRAAVLTEPDGTTSTAQIQIVSVDLIRKVAAVHVYAVEIEIPAGRFA